MEKFLVIIPITILKIVCCQSFFGIFLKDSNTKGMLNKIGIVAEMVILSHFSTVYLNPYPVIREISIFVIMMIMALVMYQVRVIKAFLLTCSFQGIYMMTHYILLKVSGIIVPKDTEFADYSELFSNMLTVINILLLYVCVLLVRARSQYIKAQYLDKEMLVEQGKSQLEMYSALNENYKKQQKRVHEFKNHIMCIENMIQNEEYSELKSYVSKIDNSYTSVGNVIDTNHIIINAVINTKYREMLEKNIVFIHMLGDLSKITMNEEDVVVLLSNLLNNAIEACEKCDKKYIKLKFVIDTDSVILSVKNTYNNIVIREGNTFTTTKKNNTGEHGIGIKNVIRIIEKYSGSYVIKNQQEEFLFSIMFPFDNVIK